MTRRSSCCCSCFSCFSGRNTPSPSGLPDASASAAAVDPNAPSPTEMVATGHHLQTPPSSSTTGAQGKSIEPSFSSSSAHQDASCAVVVKQDEVVPSPPSGGASSIPLALPCAASSSSTVPETATSSASTRVPTVAMATDDIHHSQQSVASSSTQPGEAHSSSITNTNKDAAAVDPNAPSPTEIVAIGHHLQTPPSSSTSGAQGKSIELSSSSSSADQDASCAVVVKQDEVVPSAPSGGASSIPLALPCAASSSSTVPETATSSASSRVPTVAMATDDIHHSQQSVASSSTQPGEAHSSFQGTTSSSSITNTNKDAAGLEGDDVDVDLDALIKRIYERLLLIEKGENPPQTEGAQQYWPTASETFSKLKKLISGGINVVTSVIPAEVIKTAVASLGPTQLVTAGLLVVENIFQRLEEVKGNKAECLGLLKEMFFLANIVRQFRERRQLKEDAVMHNLIKEATELIIEGHNRCCSQIESSKSSKYFNAQADKGDLDDFSKKIDGMYKHIHAQMDICIYDAIDRKKAPLSRGYPVNAVGIEESVKEITDLLESASDKNAIAIMVHGLGGMGKSTLADAVFSSVEIQGCKYSKVQLFKHIDSKPDIVELQKLILKDLMDGTVPDIRNSQGGQVEVGKMLKEVPAFIYIDNVLRPEELGQLLPKDMDKAKKVRLLITARDTDVRRALKVKTITYAMRGLQDKEAMQLLGSEIYAGTDDKDNQLDSTQLNKLAQSYGGIPKLLEVVGGFMRAEKDKQKAYEILMEDKKKWDSEVGEIESYLFAYEHLPKICRDPFLDICSFFKGWDWDTVNDIVGQIELDMLESRSLVSRGTDGVVVVHDVILSTGLKITEGVRFTYTSGKDVEELLNKKDIREIKGIWLSENNKDLVDISASKLELLCSSIRVLALGNLIKVEGNCSQTFEKLVFLQAAVPHLPFDVSQSKGLKYLKYEPRDLNFLEIPSSVRYMEFDGRSHSHAFEEISSGDLQHLKKLRILRLTHFVALKKLPEHLGVLVDGLQELTLSYCTSIQELPASISKLRSLRVIRMEYCQNIMQLPEDFGSLISLEKLNLQGCKNLKVLPSNFEKLTALKLLDLSYCERLLDLPHGLGNLTSLAELDLKGCSQLRSIPESIGDLKSLASSLDMSGCSSLKELPNGFCNLSFIMVLSLQQCSNLKKLPDRFGELVNLWELDLRRCKNLEDLCNDFHCLDSLEILDLNGCHSLKALPDCFQCLASLRRLYLSDCVLLEGKEMDKVVKIKTLQLVDIEQSEMLVKRWGEIEREGNPLESLTVWTGQDLSEDRKASLEKELLTEFDSLLSNGEGEPFHLSHHLSADSLFLGIFDYHANYFDHDFPWPLFEETIDEIQTKFEIIYIGNNFNELPMKVKGKIVGHREWDKRTTDVFWKMVSVADQEKTYDPDEPNCYFEMRTKIAGDEKGAQDYRPCWKLLAGREVEEFLLGKCRSYERLKELEARSGESNIELLRELFPTGKGETAHIFGKNYASQKGASNESSKPCSCGVEELKGKRILLDIRPLDMCYDIRLGSLMELYNTKIETMNLEVISIPLVHPDTNVTVQMLEQFSGDAPWLVLQNPWMLSRAVKYFLIKGSLPDHGWELWEEELNIMYMSIITVIEPNGKVFTADKPVLPLLDRWGPKAYPFTVDKIKELEEEEWSQIETTSTLELLFYNQESVWHKVKEVLLQQKMICLFGGDGSVKGISMKEFTIFLRNVLIEFIADIHIIYIPGFDFKESKKSKLTDATYVYYSPLPNPDMPKAEMEEMPLSNLLEHEAIRFWTRFYSLKEMVSKRDDNSKLKRIFNSIDHYTIDHHIPWMILIDKDGEIIIENGQDMISLYSKSMEEKAKRLMQVLIKGSKEDREQAL